MRKATGAIACVVALAVGLPASARADERLLAVVLVTGEDDRELAGRVEGQTSDLEVVLVIERRWTGESGSLPALGEAAAVAESHAARVVIWFERDETSWLVHIAEPAEDREFVRRVAAQGDLASSATAEGVALVVRGVLRALAAGGTIGVAEPEPPVSLLRPALPPPAEDLRRAFAAIGWRGVTAGGSTVHNGVAARAGLAAGRWQGELTTGFYPAVAIADESATIELERWNFSLGVGLDLGGSLADEAGWRAGLVVEAGATRFSRVTISAAGGLAPTAPKALWSPSSSARFRLARRLGGRAWLEIAVGAEILLRAPEFRVASGESSVVHTRLRLVEPFGALALVIDLG